MHNDFFMLCKDQYRLVFLSSFVNFTKLLNSSSLVGVTLQPTGWLSYYMARQPFSKASYIYI